ncbi:zinc finger protein 57 isoform 1 [Danaus plexippus plexippus]|uniref:Zinc finger protein 57 isoform 1 n=1 Tax=Danaus plexippus plexippus TaxID=278856 RepID=A0A212F9Z3_DANPL|nr:zinc finger and BTB domain-containing protein 41-like [Danaus plexippus plexippus]OWR50565.1 zinc finger protein 57 isoform 1 [Danaus plexippus plexippus]
MLQMAYQENLRLCYECAALLVKFASFKEQVMRSYRDYNDFITNPLQPIQPISRLQAKKLHDLSNGQTDVYEDPPEVKSEETEVEVKNVYKIESLKTRNMQETREYTQVELTGDEIEEERRLLEMGEDYVNAMFRCEKCIATFPNSEDLEDHTTNKHLLNASNYKCSICQCTFATEFSYNYHTNKHTTRYECSVCKQRFVNKRDAARHYSITHCVGMDVEVKNNDEDNNESRGQDGIQHPCEFCPKTFKWKTSLRKHLETHSIENGQKRKPYCTPCRLSFTTTSNLQKHVRTSSKHQIQLKLRKLKEMNSSHEKQENIKEKINEIKSSVNNSRHQFPCNQCDKRFLWRGNLLRHLQSHLAKLVFKTSNSVYLHKQAVHRKDVIEHLCDHCGKPFPNGAKLRAHILGAHGVSEHACGRCGASFAWHSCLSRHVRQKHRGGRVNGD